MNRHWKGVLALIAITVVGFAVAMVVGAPIFGVALLLAAVVVAFVLGTAWARPSTPPEHTDAPAPDDRFPSMRQP